MKVTLISTVLNCADRVAPFLESLDAQTRRPDEVIVVDGGSSDGTADRFRADDRITVIEVPGANIAAGRNVAIANATHEVIAVTDADCELEPGWLAAIVAPIEAGADVGAGFYAPIVDGFFHACLAAVNLPLDPGEVDPRRFMPSARRARSCVGPCDPISSLPGCSTSATRAATRSPACTRNVTPCGS
jgi:glycosyltransferase involved in cell wall biosynthesis